MSAKMIIVPQDEADKGFGLLKDIVAMVKNPDAIDEAYQRRLAAVKLTEDEIKKSEDARALIVNADSIRNELAQREAALEAAKIAHDGNVSVHQKNIQSDHDRFNEWEQRLVAKQQEQAETDASYLQQRKDLDKKTKAIEDDRAAWEITKKSEEDVILAKKEEQKIIDEKQAETASKLKAKAARLAAEAEKDE